MSRTSLFRRKNGLFQDQPRKKNPPGLKYMFWNAGGLTNVKFTEFKNKVSKENIDVYGIVEAGAATETKHLFQMPGYQTFVLKRGRQCASGMIVAAKASLTVKFSIKKEMGNTDKHEAIEMDVWKENVHRRIFILYNPPKNKPSLTWLETIWDRNCILYGDLNAPSTRWGYKQTNAVGNVVEAFIDSNPVQYIHNGKNETTFIAYNGSTSRPDALLSHPAIASKLKISLTPPLDGFGHSILSIQDFCSNPGRPEERRPRWNLKKADWSSYKIHSDETITSNLLSNNVDSSLKNINNAILKCAYKWIPRGQVRRYRPFWNEELEKLKNERDKAFSKVKCVPSVDNRVILKQKVAQLKKGVISSKRSCYRTFLAGLDYRKNAIKAHHFLTNLNNGPIPPKNPIVHGSKQLTNDKDIAHYFCKHYAAVSNFRPSKKISRFNNSLVQTCFRKGEWDLVNSQLTRSELEAALIKTSKKKSAGPDEILPEFLINLGSKAKSTILDFLNSIWLNHYPSEWRKAEIIPILKRGKTADCPENFRPIALTSVFSKVYERIILGRLQRYIERYRIISQEQAGFTKHRGTIEQVTRFSQEVKDGFHRKQSTLAVFVDFKTAFDRVCRKILIQKLKDSGVSGCLLSSVQSFLSQRFIRVRYHSEISSFRQIRQGVPQGSVLSPVLFNIMIDDILSSIKEISGVNALLYADDLVIWATSSNIEALQSSLNLTLAKLKNWSNLNEMVVNTEKTEFQLFSLSTKQHHVTLNYGGRLLRQTNCAKYLGVELDSKLSWSTHIQTMRDKGISRSLLLKRLTGTKWGASQDVLAMAYKTYVRPAMEYANELTVTSAITQLNKLDKVQNQALRIMTGGPKSTPITAMELQTNIEPLKYRREEAALKLSERLSRTGVHYWKNYKPASDRLKTQHSFLSSVSDLKETYELTQVLQDPEPFSSNREHIPRQTVPGYTSLIKPVSKDECPPYELRELALETIYNRFPKPDWLHLYTDGSAIGGRANGGAGVYCTVKRVAAPVGAMASSFDGEIRAILLALEMIPSLGRNKVVLLIDSQAAIKALTSHRESESKGVLEGRRILEELTFRGTTVALQWIPSHCGIWGNEQADLLAKNGSQMPMEKCPIPYNTSKNFIEQIIKKQRVDYQQIAAEGKRWACLTEPQNNIPHTLPRYEFVANFRTTTGHDYLNAHLHRINIKETPFCTLCHQPIPMTIEHLYDCPQLEDVRNNFTNDDTHWSKCSKLYWAARGQMA